MDDSLEDFLGTAEDVWKQLKATRNDEEEVSEEEKEVSAELKQIGNITGRLENRDLGQLTEEEVIELDKAVGDYQLVCNSLLETERNFLEIIQQLEELQNEGIQIFQLLEEGKVQFNSGQQIDNYSRAVETVTRSEEILANQISVLKNEIQRAESEGEKLLEILEQVNQRSSEESEKEFQALEENVREKHEEIAGIGEDQLEADFEEVESEFDNQTRRQVLKIGSSAAVLGLSGCMYTPDPGKSPSKAQNQQSGGTPETEMEEIVQRFNIGVENYNKGMKDYNDAGENFREQNIETAEENAKEAAEDFENSEEAFREAATLARKVENKDAVDLLERGLRKSALMKQAAELMVQTAETYDTGDRSERRRKYNEYREKVNEANQIKPPSGEKLKEFLGFNN